MGAGGGAVITHTDITERKQAEEKLRLAARVFSDAHEGITITNPQGVILDVNDAFTRITGYSREEVLAQNPLILHSGRQDKAFYAAMWSSLTATGHWSGDFWNRRKDVVVIAELLNISAMRNADGSTLQYVAHFTDISKRVIVQARIDTLAFYDPLTNLPNRRLLLDRLDQALHASVRHKRKKALLFVDLDNFHPGVCARSRRSPRHAQHRHHPFCALALVANEDPLRRAELAVFQAKAAGRNTLRFFDAHMQATVSAHAALEADLREAVQTRQFVLYYQPQVVGAGRMTGVETLVRWQHPRRGTVFPADFIPLAEETGLILSIGQ